MKSYSKLMQLTAFLGVVYFLLAGTGYNIVDYCCDSCEMVGIEYVSHHTCHDIHHTNDASTVFANFEFPDTNHSSSCCEQKSTTAESSSSIVQKSVDIPDDLSEQPSAEAESSSSVYDFTSSTHIGCIPAECTSSGGRCELERLQLDDYPVTATLQLQVDVSIRKIPVAVLSSQTLSSIQTTLFLQYPPPEPMSRMGRNLLAHKSVLII